LVFQHENCGVTGSDIPKRADAMKRIVGWMILFVMVTTASGCGFLVSGGAGAAGGYFSAGQGHTAQSLVEKENRNKS
jgi:hypothetical protein